MLVLSFPLHNSGSVPRRINGEVILRRGVLFFFFFCALSRYISCIFICVPIIPFPPGFLTFLSRLA